MLEAYLLGGLTLAESEQVAGAVCRFPEVAVELAKLEEALLQSARHDAVEPPAHLEDQIWAAIEANTRKSEEAVTSASVSKPAPQLIPMTQENSTRPKSWLRAAVWIGLAGSIITNVLLWSSGSQRQKEIAALQQQAKSSEQGTQQLLASLDRYKREAEMMATPGIQPVPMLSTQPGHSMAATFYWDKVNNQAYVSVQKLPPPPAGMQYQLWAIADGKPVDIGMLENEIVIQGGMQKVPKPVAAGQAFAVSLEKAGGRTTPTADKIYLLGKMPQA